MRLVTWWRVLEVFAVGVVVWGVGFASAVDREQPLRVAGALAMGQAVERPAQPVSGSCAEPCGWDIQEAVFQDIEDEFVFNGRGVLHDLRVETGTLDNFFVEVDGGAAVPLRFSTTHAHPALNLRFEFQLKLTIRGDEHPGNFPTGPVILYRLEPAQ